MDTTYGYEYRRSIYSLCVLVHVQTRCSKLERERSQLVTEAAQLRARIETVDEREHLLEEKRVAESEALQERLREKQLEIERTRLDFERLKVRTSHSMHTTF